MEFDFRPLVRTIGWLAGIVVGLLFLICCVCGGVATMAMTGVDF